jgi:hypothetical protein
MAKRLAVLCVSKAFLLDRLGLNDDVDLHDIKVSFYEREIEMVVEHQSLGEISEGQQLPKVDAILDSTGFCCFKLKTDPYVKDFAPKVQTFAPSVDEG